MHRICRRAAAAAVAVAMLAALAVGAVRTRLPDTFVVAQGETFEIEAMPWLSVRPAAKQAQQAGAATPDTSSNTTLALFGLIPVKTVRTVTQQRSSVTVCGTPFGIKMFSNGALVVGFSDLYTVLGAENPAKEAGLRLGDLIVSANGRAVRTNQELSEAIGQAGGGQVEIVYYRGAEQKQCSLVPVEDGSGAWKAGVWVRDSSAGIGTLTFTDGSHNTFAGLGHAISDTDTGIELPLLSGEIVPVTITGYVAGAAGSPGELRGEFSGGSTLGVVKENDVTGVYGVLTSTVEGVELPVANRQEVKPGPAQILATIEGQTPQLYEARIEKVNLNASDPNRNMLVRVTDKALLEATGGIVQGMSGSPVVQDGRLVGAVTHVLVNDPSRGYGIFAQTMLERAQTVAKLS